MIRFHGAAGQALSRIPVVLSVLGVPPVASAYAYGLAGEPVTELLVGFSERASALRSSAMIKLTDDAIRSRLGARIRALRTARELSQAELAERLGRDRGWKYISTLECGRGSPSLGYLVSLAHQGFEIKLASLLFGIDENLGPELQALSEGIAGLPMKTRRGLLRSVELVLRAGEQST